MKVTNALKKFILIIILIFIPERCLIPKVHTLGRSICLGCASRSYRCRRTLGTIEIRSWSIVVRFWCARALTGRSTAIVIGSTPTSIILAATLMMIHCGPIEIASWCSGKKTV